MPFIIFHRHLSQSQEVRHHRPVPAVAPLASAGQAGGFRLVRQPSPSTRVPDDILGRRRRRDRTRRGEVPGSVGEERPAAGTHTGHRQRTGTFKMTADPDFPELLSSPLKDTDILCHKMLLNVGKLTKADRCSLFLARGPRDNRHLEAKLFDVEQTTSKCTWGTTLPQCTSRRGGTSLIS